jgi:hypothetical protein
MCFANIGYNEVRLTLALTLIEIGANSSNLLTLDLLPLDQSLDLSDEALLPRVNMYYVFFIVLILYHKVRLTKIDSSNIPEFPPFLCSFGISWG